MAALHGIATQAHTPGLVGNHQLAVRQTGQQQARHHPGGQRLRALHPWKEQRGQAQQLHQGRATRHPQHHRQRPLVQVVVQRPSRGSAAASSRRTSINKAPTLASGKPKVVA